MSEATRVRVAWGIWFACAAAWLAPLAWGYFLADDFSFLAGLAASDAKGALFRDTAATFLSGQTAGESHFYRPLPFATFAACYAMFGANAAPWLAVNVVAHLGCALLVAVLALQLQADRSWRSHFAALAGATIFLCLAPGLEAAAWVAARCDAFATFFCLLACVSFLNSRKRWDSWTWISLAAFVAAMLSKETAAIVPPAIVVLATWRRRGEPLAAARRVAAILRDAAPWFALGVAYLALRAVMFGSPFVVYGHAKPGLFLVEPQRWIAFLETFPPWLSAQFWVRGPRIGLESLLAAFALASLAVIRFDREARAGALAVVALVALSIMEFAPHASGLAADGSAGRLFHLTDAFVGVLAGVVGASRILRGAPLVLVFALAVAAGSTGTRTRDRWLAAESGMRGIATQIAQIHAGSKDGEYDLVVLPSTLGSMPFGINAQAGLAVPPVQETAFTSRLLVQEDAEVEGISTAFARGIIANLRRFPLEELGTRGVEGAAEYPTRVHCWVRRTARLVVLPRAPETDAAAWAQATRSAMKAAGCAMAY